MNSGFCLCIPLVEHFYPDSADSNSADSDSADSDSIFFSKINTMDS